MPAADPAGAEWALARMRGRDDTVGVVVPAGFEAVLRVMNPFPDGRRWADAAPAYLAAGAAERYPYPAAVDLPEGELADVVADALVPLLAAATTTPQRGHYGVWTGWGEWRPGSINVCWPVGEAPPAAERRRARAGAQAEFEAEQRPLWDFVASCPVVEWWGGRDMFLCDGPVDAVGAIGVQIGGAMNRRFPQWWWPDDRAWFVGLEIDHPWTYVTGSRALVEAVAALALIESVRVAVDDVW